MSVRLIESLAATEAMAELFSDASILRAMLDFEAALARVQGRLGVIPAAAASAIEQAARAADFSAPDLARETLRAGTPGIPLVNALTARVAASDPAAAAFVHWGATSQDVADTALVLLLARAEVLFAADHARLDQALRNLSTQHRGTVMLGRTLLQPAPPVTLGLKAAGWLGAIRRGWTRLAASFAEACIVQFGGASGTLAGLGGRGVEVGRALAAELGLGFPDAPWHTHRDRLAALITACGVQTGSLGKMACDVALLMQAEVAEAAEPGGAGRGGSSTMPHKHNPIACSLALAASHRVPGLVAAFLAAMVQEHERAVGGWQSEWPTVAGVMQAAGLAAASMVEVAEGLAVDADRMRANLEATRGTIFAERVSLLLTPSIGRAAAHQLLEQATQQSIAQRRRLVEILAEMPEVTRILPAAKLSGLDAPESYLGSAEMFRTRLTSSE